MAFCSGRILAIAVAMVPARLFLLPYFLVAGSIVSAQYTQEEAPPPPDTVSVFELQHQAPPQALKEGQKADKCYKQKNLACYIDHTRKAIAIYPDYLAARRNLGIAYLMVGENEKAIAEFQEVLQRDPHAVVGYAATSCAYLMMDKDAEAEQAARRALDLDASNEPSSYYLGVSLTLQHKNYGEALHHLQKAAGRFPKAHLASAYILERLGMKNAAKGQLEEYLASGEKDSRSTVSTWLSALH